MKKTIEMLMPATRKHWVGDGFNVNPVLSNMAFSEEISPFLMFDYAAPKTFPATTKKLGVGMHPHRGFETITIAFQGEVEHKDSEGNTGVISNGDVQWMTAGSGIFHEEFHSRKFAKSGGPFEMVQLWVNLPARLKMVKPRYQDIRAGDIPIIPLEGEEGEVRLISGSFKGQKGPAMTEFDTEKRRGEIQLWDIRLPAKKTFHIPFPAKQTSILFARSGQVSINNAKLPEHRACLLSKDGTEIEITTGDSAVSLVLMGGEPIVDSNGQVEPIANHGPMVMNTQKEIRDAMQWAHKEQMKFYSY